LNPALASIYVQFPRRSTVGRGRPTWWMQSGDTWSGCCYNVATSLPPSGHC